MSRNVERRRTVPRTQALFASSNEFSSFLYRGDLNDLCFLNRSISVDQLMFVKDDMILPHVSFGCGHEIFLPLTDQMKNHPII